ncbi:hypothetical protein [Streptomyces sp. SAI-170]|uniref:hypothetical protein n=1 Tax=Streptomyces sp. SAI-170 TaxID=3377729 RepID=UPI003C7B93C6
MMNKIAQLTRGRLRAGYGNRDPPTLRRGFHLRGHAKHLSDQLLALVIAVHQFGCTANGNEQFRLIIRSIRMAGANHHIIDRALRSLLEEDERYPVPRS